MTRPTLQKGPLAAARHPAQNRAQAPPQSWRKAPIGKTKVGFYVHPGDAARARGPYLRLPRTVTARSWSEFLAGALMKEVERLEREYNGVKPFPDADRGELPSGRPMGQ